MNQKTNEDGFIMMEDTRAQLIIVAQRLHSLFKENFNLETIVKKPSEKLYEATTISKGKSPNAFVSYYPEKFSYDRYAYLRSYK